MINPQRTALAVVAVFAIGAAASPAPAWARTARRHHTPDPIDQLVAQANDPSSDAAADPPTDALADQDAQGTPSPTVAQVDDWAVQSGDAHGKPFIVIDKPTAEVFVFDASGGLIGAAPALLGSALGDTAAPGIGDLELSDTPRDERPTEAGRFIAHIGPAKGMSSVLWVDFDTSLSMHPVITSNPQEQRLQRLRSPSPDDRRITHGCINVPAKFYREVVHKTFADTDSVVYILPDTESLDQVFPQFAATDPDSPKARRHRHQEAESDQDTERPLSTFGARF